MFAHDDRVTDLYLDAMDEVFAEIGGILRADRVRESLTGPVAHSGFKRLTN
jgi:glutamate-1-semialdehyde 2,1-aminomutase